MTRIDDFSEATQEMVDRHISRPFPDAIPVLERWFNGLSRSQLIFFEQYWKEFGPSTSEREIWEALKRMPERATVKASPRLRREAVVIKGRKVVVWRNSVTGRFVRRSQR